MLKSSLCDYCDAHILAKGTIAVPNMAAEDDDANNANKRVIFKNRVPFVNCVSAINNTQVDNTKDINIVMLMGNSIESSNNCSKTSWWMFVKIYQL